MYTYSHFTLFWLRLTSIIFESTDRMKLTEQFIQLISVKTSRLPGTFLHLLTAVVIVVLQWSIGSSVKEATIVIASSYLACYNSIHIDS